MTYSTRDAARAAMKSLERANASAAGCTTPRPVLKSHLTALREVRNLRRIAGTTDDASAALTAVAKHPVDWCVIHDSLVGTLIDSAEYFLSDLRRSTTPTPGVSPQPGGTL